MATRVLAASDKTVPAMTSWCALKCAMKASICLSVKSRFSASDRIRAMRLWLGHVLGDVCEEDGIIHPLNIHAGTCFGEVGILPYFRAGTIMDGCIFEVGV